MSERTTPETDAAQFGTGKVTTDFARRLERERDEARNKMADALQEVDLRALDYERMKQERDEAREALRTLAEHGENEIQKLIKECDEAREEVASLRLEAKYHDEADALRKCRERERDEAREDAAHWKTEYEIVVDRLRGRKHPSDNGIIADDEIIPKLERERDELLQWKKETLLVESQWNEQAVGRLLGLQLGESIKPNIEPKLRQLIRERDEAREERDALRDAVNALHDYVHGKRNDDKDISEILNGAMKI